MTDRLVQPSEMSMSRDVALQHLRDYFPAEESFPVYLIQRKRTSRHWYFSLFSGRYSTLRDVSHLVSIVLGYPLEEYTHSVKVPHESEVVVKLLRDALHGKDSAALSVHVL